VNKSPNGRKRGAVDKPAPRKRTSRAKASEIGAQRRPRDRERTIADILDAAERLLDEKGPDGFGLAELGRKANISFGLIHHYFGGKEGLLKAVLRRTLRGMGREIRRLQEDRSFWRRDAPAVQVVFDTFAERRGFSRLLAWGLLTGLIGPEDVAHEFRQERDALGSMLDAFRAAAPKETQDEVAVITTLLVSSVLGFNLLRPLLVGSVAWNQGLDERLRTQLVSAMVELTQHR
jgi:AcrR family transcriptional regulator